MKKAFAVVLCIFIISITGGMSVFAEDSVPMIPSGALVADDNDSEFSSEELNNIVTEIKELMKTEKWITGVRLNNAGNLILIGCEDSCDPAKEKELARKLSDKYGNAVSGVISFGGDLNGDTQSADKGGLATGAAEKPDMLPYTLLCCLALVVFCAAAVRMRYKRRLALQSANGGVISSGEAISKQDIIKSIRKSGYEPRDEVFSEIRRKTEHTE